MKVAFTEAAWEDYLWLQDNDKKLLKRVNLLIKDILRNPTEGIGKPELLKANLSGYLSRRVTSEHRLIYGITSEDIIIIACRFHYTL